MPTRIRLLPLLTVLLALVSLACFALPMYVIWPFRHQGATELAVALSVKRIAPWLSLVCAVLCAAMAMLVWPRLRRWTARAAIVLALVVALAGAYLAHVNVYEKMFHHLDAPRFEPASDAKLDSDDMVLAVRVNGVDRAYPIREIAYHHVVNDTVGGEPIVATY